MANPAPAPTNSRPRLPALAGITPTRCPCPISTRAPTPASSASSISTPANNPGAYDQELLPRPARLGSPSSIFTQMVDMDENDDPNAPQPEKPVRPQHRPQRHRSHLHHLLHQRQVPRSRRTHPRHAGPACPVPLPQCQRDRKPPPLLRRPQVPGHRPRRQPRP